MFGKLKGLFSSKPTPDPLHDSVLGVVRFNSDERMWEAKCPGASSSCLIRIAGETAPDPQLLSHARDVAREFDGFCAVVSAFLREQAVKFKGAEAEVQSLTLESLSLVWPKRPNDGMIYFEGGSQDILWRCDYINRIPVGLSFDS